MAARARRSAAVKLLLDEMLPTAIALQLRARGHDVRAVSERADLRTRSDELILSTAQSEGLTVVTENVPDFQRLARQEIREGRSHFGLILMSNRRFPRKDPRTLGRVVAALDVIIRSTTDSTNMEHWLE